MKRNNWLTNTQSRQVIVLKKTIMAMGICLLPSVIHAVQEPVLSADVVKGLNAVSQVGSSQTVSSQTAVSRVSSSQTPVVYNFINDSDTELLNYDDASLDSLITDDDIDAVVDVDALESEIDDDVDDFTDDGDNGYIDESGLGEQTDVNSGMLDEEGNARAPIDLAIQKVPLNAISPNTIATFVEVLDKARQDYVRPVNDEQLFEYAIAGMLEKLDSHAEYLSPKSYDRLRSFTDGEIGQVGLSAIYDIEAHAWVIDSVMPRSSASEAGIKVGDELIQIKKVELTSDMQPQDIDQLLSGIAGSQVQVTVTSPDYAKRKVTLQRNLAKNNKLVATVQEGIAIVRLPIFQNTTKDQLLDALRNLDTPISGVVLDIRNNPGGVLSSAIDVASLFMKDSGLIQVRNRTNSGQTIASNGVPYLADIPVIVLQNRYSASAAEVLSSSLKSNRRARVVGEKSFGKGTVQEVIALKNGGAIKLTVAEYRDVNGAPIDGIGIMPDVRFLHDGSDWQQQAVTLLVSQERSVDVQIDDIDDTVPLPNDY